MGPKSLKKLFYTISVILVLSVSLPAWAKDPAAERASYIEVEPAKYQANLEKLSLRWKLISSRALILYMLDILPDKGNPYYHMAQFSVQSSLEAFKAAHLTTVYHDNETDPYWLPIKKGLSIGKEDMKNEGAAGMINYFAQYIATADVMKNIIQPVLAKSIVIGSIEETVGSDVKKKFDRAWDHVNYFAQRYNQFYDDNQFGKDLLKKAKQRVVLLVTDSVAKGMQPYLSYVQTPANKQAINSYFEQLKKITSGDLNHVKVIKAKASALLDSSKSNNKLVEKTFYSVDLPDSGDIDGAEQAFEVAMRLEVGYQVITKLLNEIKENW